MDSDGECLEIQVIISENPSFWIDYEKINLIDQKIRGFLRLDEFEVSYLLVAPQKIRLLNNQFRKIDQETDVLSFPQYDWLDPHFPENDLSKYKFIGEYTLGDIAICPEKAFENAESIGHGLCREFTFLMVHGLLHLCGHDHIDKSDEKIMKKFQNQIIAELEKDSKGNPYWLDCIGFKEPI